MFDLFLQLGIILGIAVAVSFFMRLLKQPLIVGYIITGLIISIGLSGFILFEPIAWFAHLGVALLLFIVGLGLKPDLLYETGPVALLTGAGQIIFTSVVGYGIGWLLGFSPVTSFYLAMAFTFSSTIIIVRLLHERGETDSLYGRIVIGFFLVQDLVAMALLLGISLFSRTVGTEGGVVSFLSITIFNFAVLALGVFILGAYIIPYVDKWFAKNNEMLLLFALFICFGVIAAFQYFSYSLEIGALLAGVILASSPYQREIAARLSSLRDFFLVMFFVSLGFTLAPANIAEFWWPALIFSLFILIGNPLIVMLIMRSMGYSLRTMFMAGLTVAQISEFSLILLLLGVSLGHLESWVADLGTLVGIITIAVSSYMILKADELFKVMRPHLSWLDDGRSHGEDKVSRTSYDTLVFGAHRLGGGIIEGLKRMRWKFLVVDSDPYLVEKIKKKRVPVMFGDVGELAVLEAFDWKGVRLVISSVPSREVNMIVANFIKKIPARRRPVFVCVAARVEEAKDLYKAGASYVVMPPYLGRRYIAELVKTHKFDKKKYIKEQMKHVKDLATVV